MRIEVEGMNAIINILNDFPIEDEIENRALNGAAKVIKAAIVEEAPRDEREVPNEASIKNNIKSNRPKDGEIKIHTGGAYHAHIVEGGRSGGSKYALKNGKRQLVTWGPTAPNPFFTRGFEKSKNEAIQSMENEIKKALGL